MNKWSTILLLLVAFNSSCEDPLLIEDPSDVKLVVEGKLTSELTNQIIKLSTTSGFSSTLQTPKITGATVWVTDLNGTVYIFPESGIPGEYQSENAFAGVVGNDYKLHIETSQGAAYESDYQTLRASPPLELITFESRLLRNPDDLKYFVTAHLTDPSSVGDFYRWKVFKNGTQFGTVADIVLRSDRLFNSNPFSIEFDTFPFDIGDQCTIEQFSLTQEAFDFFRLLQIQAGELGESSSTAPSQVEGNVRNLNDSNEVVLGFFYATNRQQLSVTISE